MELERDLLRTVTPLALLTVLSDGPASAPDLGDSVARCSENLLALTRSDVRAQLRRLEANGLVESELHGGTSGRKLRHYSITADGYTWLVTQRAQLENFQEGLGLLFEHAPRGRLPRSPNPRA